jgi:hypothetical protein
MVDFVEISLYLSSGVSPDNIYFLLEFGNPWTFHASPDSACPGAELFLTADPRGRYKNDITTRLFDSTLRVFAIAIICFQIHMFVALLSS